MKAPEPKPSSRHAKVFDLLRQERIGKRPADRAAVAVRLLDDVTAHQMITDAVGSLKKPVSGRLSPLQLISRMVRASGNRHSLLSRIGSTHR